MRRNGIPVVPRPLSWAPPALTAPITHNVSVDGSNRTFVLTPGQDYIIQMPSSPVSVPATLGAANIDQLGALVNLINGRNIRIIGGHFNIPDAVSTTLTSAYTDGDPTLNVVSTTGFPSAGIAQGGGYSWYYTAKTGTTFTGATRRTFAYTNALPFPLATGTTMWIGEPHRDGINLVNQTGVVHIEGIKVDGDALDGVLVQAQTATTMEVQVQNCRFGPLRHHDLGTFFDGHNDGVQLISGPAFTRLDRVTVDTAGQAMLSKRGTFIFGHYNAGPIITRDVNAYGTPFDGASLSSYLYDNYDNGAWEVQNCYGRSHFLGKAELERNLVNQVVQGKPATDFCTAEQCGLNYVTPGYL